MTCIAALAQIEVEKQALQKRLDAYDAPNAQDSGQSEKVTRPKGTAGNHWGIQVAMGLDGSAKKYEIYKAIQVR